MFAYLLLLLVTVPLLELWLLFRMAAWCGWPVTFAVAVLTGILGAALARSQGLRTFQRIQREFESGVLPGDALVDAALILAAGLVLVTPGMLTDLCGFALLVPPLRRSIKRRVSAALKKRIVVMDPGGSEEFIDVPATGRDAAEPSNHPDE